MIFGRDTRRSRRSNPVALTLPTEGGGRYAAAQIYDWTITNSRKPEMAIN
jgi:hypothetical protein